MILNERDIIRNLASGRLVITPLLDPATQIGPSSVDIRLGFEFEVFNRRRYTHLDPLASRKRLRVLAKHYSEKVHVRPMERFVLHPQEFVLASTLEYFRLPLNIAGRLEGRSTWGRLGLQVHSTAGFVDPGFEGLLTFELLNIGGAPLSLYPGIRVAQVCFFAMRRTAIPYVKKLGAKYFGKMGTSSSKFYEDAEFDRIRAYSQHSGRDDDVERDSPAGDRGAHSDDG